VVIIAMVMENAIMENVHVIKDMKEMIVPILI